MSMQTLQRIPPIHPEKIPPKNAVAAGVTPDGRQLFQLTRRRARAVPMIDTQSGERVWRRNPLNGEPLYPRNQPGIYEEELLFTLESPGNGSIEMTPYVAMTPEEMAEREYKVKVEQMRDSLADAMVQADMTPAQLLALLQGQAKDAVVQAEETESQAEYPLYLPVGRWQLSNGTVITGKREDAEEAERLLVDEEREADVAQVLAESDSAGIEGF